jgi:signal transduction histidine kinase
MILTGLLVTLVIILVITLVSRNMRSVIAEETQKRGIAIAQLFGATNLNYLKMYIYLGIQQNAQVAKTENDLVYVIVYDKEGRIAAHTENAGLSFVQAKEPDAIKSILAKQPLFREVSTTDDSSSQSEQKVFDISVPIRTNESPGRWGTVRIGISPENMYRRLREIQVYILQIGLLSLFFGVIGSVILSDRITVPISRLVEGSIQAAQGDLSHRINIRTGDELEGLANNFNYMMDQIKLHQEQRIKSEKMAAVGYMVNTIVHDCRTPITVIKGFASVLKDFEVPPEQEKECLDFIDFEVERMERMLDEILHFALDKKSPLKLTEDNLDKFMTECGIEISALFRDTEIRFTQDLQSNALISIDRDKLRRAILNITANAKEALKKKGEFKVNTRLSPSHAIIRLSDNAGGIPIALQKKIFDPFFTHGKVGGFGLGMSITKKIIDDHSGEISLESEVGQGTTFIIQIPLSRSGSQTLQKAHSA